MNQNSNIEKVEAGKQIGTSYSSMSDNKISWCSIAIQKWNNSYKVYISEIFESNMVSEKYEKELIENFSNIDSAIHFIHQNSDVKFENLTSLKGQKIFNPEFNK